MHSSLFYLLHSPDFPTLALGLPGSCFTSAPVEGEIRVLQHVPARSPASPACQVNSCTHVLQSEVDPKPHGRDLSVSPQPGKVSLKRGKYTTDGARGFSFLETGRLHHLGSHLVRQLELKLHPVLKLELQLPAAQL